MSATKISLMRYECKCELRDCPGYGKSWVSKDPLVPERCAFCGRRTWNGTDKRTNVLLTANGKTQSASKWAEETGLSKQLIGHRHRAGWSDLDAVTIPAGKRRAS